jgi:hypothetical protein
LLKQPDKHESFKVRFSPLLTAAHGSYFSDRQSRDARNTLWTKRRADAQEVHAKRTKSLPVRTVDNTFDFRA